MNISEQKLDSLIKEIEEICKKVNRNFKEITVLAACKYGNSEQINELIKAGIKVIGENKVQDAQEKFPKLLAVKKHFIGHLQTNKVKVAVKIFDVIESVDSLKLAEKINEECGKLNKIMPIYVEVNIANDLKKHGINANDLADFLANLKSYKNLQIKGLMTIIPYAENVEDSRMHFRKMKEFFDNVKLSYPGMEVLSMGMSHDFKIAIEEGATEIRIGSRLFK